MRRQLILLLSLSTLLFSCQSEDERLLESLQDHIDPHLAKISPSLAIVAANTSLATEINCLVADAIGHESRNRQLDSQCAVLREVKEETDKIIKNAKASKAAPEQGYIFFAWKGIDASTKEPSRFGVVWTERRDEPIGLFSTLEKCRQAEHIFRDLDISTRPCRSWRESEFFLDPLLSGKDDGACQCPRATWPSEFKRYSDDQDLADAELEARKDRRGLWADAQPIPPWEWRKLKRGERPILPVLGFASLGFNVPSRAIAIADRGYRPTFDVVLAGKSCQEDDRQLLICTYRVGNDLQVTIVGVGSPSATIYFDRSRGQDGDFYGVFGLLHQCIIVKRGPSNSSDEDSGPGSLLDFAFISPRTGKVYRNWMACQGY